MLPRWKRVLRPVAIGILLVFTWVAIEPWNFAQAAQGLPNPRLASRQPSATTPQKPATAAETFEESLRIIKGEVRAAVDGEDFQQRLAGQLQALQHAVEEGVQDLEATRQAVDRLSLAMEAGRGQVEALKAFRAQEQQFRKRTHDLRLRAAGIEGVLQGMPLPKGIARSQQQAKEAFRARTQALTVRLTAIAKRAEQQQIFEQQAYGTFVRESIEVEQALRQLRASLEALAQEATPERRRAQLLSQVMAKRQGLLAADRQIRQEFAQTEARLNKAGLPPEILDRHAQAVQQYEGNFQKLRDLLDQVDQLHQEYLTASEQGDQTAAASKEGDLESKLTELNQFLQQNVKEPPHTPLDPKKLPHRTPQVTPRKPRLKKDDFSELRQPIRLAFHGDPTTLLLAQATPDLPTPEDLAETIEVQFTPAIQALAAQLENNPVQIYNFVRNNIAFVPTFGSIQGAEGCRLSKECNAHDTASLLIALLRASGIAARYVIGTVEIDPDRFRSAMGDFQDLQAAARLASSGGIPVSLVNVGNRIVAVRMEHVWVEAYVDYIPSRGAVHKQGDTWIPLDAALKPTRFQPPLDIQTSLGVDPQAIFDDLLATGTTGADGNSVTGISALETNTRLTSIVESLKTFVAQNLPDATVGEVLGAVKIQPQALSVLPATLREKVLVVGGRLSELPPSSRHQVTLQVMDRFGIAEEIRLERAIPELAGRRVTVAYIPATEADVATINSFGGLFETPPYLVNLRPVVYVDGEPVGAGSAVTMGTPQQIRVSFQEPDGGTDAVEHLITAGTHAALGLDLQRVSREALEARTAKLQAALDLLGIVDVNWDDVMGEILHLHAQTYFLQVEGFSRVTAHQLNVAALKRPAEMLATFAPAFGFLFGAAVDVTNVGMNVDVRRYVVSASPRTGERDLERDYILTTGNFGSAAEHSVFQLLQGAQSVSAVKLIFEANNRGIPIFAIDATNVDVILPQLTVSSAVVNDVQNAVAAGKRILIPRDNVPLLDWNGVGYIVLDPVTGAGAYLISGGISGGGTAEPSQALDILRDLLTVLSFVLSEFKTIAGALRVLSKAVAAAGVLGRLLIAASAVATGYSVWKDTGVLWKGLAAGAIDLGLSLLSGAIIGAAAGIFLPFGAGLIALAITVVVVTVAAILAEQAIFRLLGFTSGFLWRYIQRKVLVQGATRERTTEGFPPFPRLKRAWGVAS